MIRNSKFEIINSRKGFTLIELMVAMFIFVLLMGAMVAVSVAGFRSYGKSKAIKTVTEDVGFAINSIAKDVRMGKIESIAACSDGKCLVLTRNVDQKMICYKIESGDKILRLYEGTNSSCVTIVGTTTKDIVSLDTMNFSTNSRFYGAVTTDTQRGWAEINLNIVSPGMDTDSISVQTIVSSRDYGWEAL